MSNCNYYSENNTAYATFYDLNTFDDFRSDINSANISIYVIGSGAKYISLTTEQEFTNISYEFGKFDIL